MKNLMLSVGKAMATLVVTLVIAAIQTVLVMAIVLIGFIVAIGTSITISYAKAKAALKP